MRVTLLALLIAGLACCGKSCEYPPRQTDGKTCSWNRETAGVEFTNGTCIKDGLVLTCMYQRDEVPQVVCGSTLPLPAENSK